MFVDSKANGFFLLLTFGLLCGLIAGALFGSVVAMTVVLPGIKNEGLWAMLIKSPILPLYGAWVGALIGILPGICYGLISYYFTRTTYWLLGGAACGMVPCLALVIMFGQFALLYGAVYGVVVSLVNVNFPNWWGMRLRAEGIELLHRKR